MYTTNNILAELDYNDLQVKQLVRTPSYEVLSVSLEAGGLFPEHTSPTDAQILVLEGEVYFGIDNEIFPLEKYQIFSFKAMQKHYVKALTNTKFLIIR